MRDGTVRSDTPVDDRLDAREQLAAFLAQANDSPAHP
jgi:hypothetical protein